MAQTPVSTGAKAQSQAFEAISKGDWKDRVERDLKGRCLEDLASVDRDGLRIDPLYVAPEGQRSAYQHAGVSGWQIRARVEAPSWAESLEHAETAVDGGAEAILLQVASTADPRGVSFTHTSQLRGFLDALSAPEVPVSLCGVEAPELLGGWTHPRLLGLGLDPFAAFARGASVEVAHRHRDVALRSVQGGLAGLPLCVDSASFHGAGATHAFELAIGLASVVGWMRAGSEAGLTPAAVLAAVEHRLALSTDMFTTISKLRAAGRCWDQLCEAVGVDTRMRVHAMPSRLLETSRGAWVNSLRNTVYCFSGALGGVESVTLSAHDIATGASSKLGRRLAINTQHILRLESHLDQVVDPAAGSYFIEARTEAIAQKAWGYFQDIEGRGGLMAALRSGWVAATLQESREAHLAALNHEKAGVLGVNLHVDPDDNRPLPSGPRAVLFDRSVELELGEGGA